jgi:Na+/proline symporter
MDTRGGVAFAFETPLAVLSFTPPQVLVQPRDGEPRLCLEKDVPANALYIVKAEPVLFPGGGAPPHAVKTEVEVGRHRLRIAKSEGITGGKAGSDALGGLAGFALFAFLLGMLGIGLGYPGAPHVLVRYMAAKGDKEIRRGRIIALSWGILAQFGAIWMGLSARVLFPAIEDPEYGLMAASKMFLHPVLAGVMLAAAISAMRSTADSQLLVAASSAARDIYQKMFRRNASESGMMKISRWTVLIMGLASIALALSQSRVVFWFVLFSWAGLGAAFGPILILALFGKRKLSPSAAIGGMLTGFGVTVAWKLWIKGWIVAAGGPSIYELPPAFFSALIVAWFLNRASPPAGHADVGAGKGPAV